MNATYYTTLYDYSRWANGRVLHAAEGISEHEFVAPGPGGYRSLRGTLAHILGAEWVWHQRLQGTSPASLPAETDIPSVTALRALWQEQEARMRSYLAALNDADLDRMVQYRTTRGQAYSHPLWQILAHLHNHGTQHRSEAALMLTGLGHSPGDLDLIVYLRQQQA